MANIFGAIQETITEAYKTAMGRDKWKAKWRENMGSK